MRETNTNNYPNVTSSAQSQKQTRNSIAAYARVDAAFVRVRGGVCVCSASYFRFRCFIFSTLSIENGNRLL